MRDWSTERKAKFMRIQESVRMAGIGLRHHKGGLKDNKVTKLPKLSGLGPSCTYFSILLTLMLPLMLHSSEAFTITLSEHLPRVVESETFELAALGRPLYPGMLYDCRKHSFIPGVTLWDEQSLKKNLDIRSKPHTYLKFSSSDSLSDKCSLLDISASLKASFMSGLVDVEGSAKYLHDTKSSNQQSRVTMHYRETTRFEQLTMTQLGHITYPQVFDQKTATHVVTGVLYGAHGFMVFDQTFSDYKKKQKIDGELNALVKKIPEFSITGKGEVKMTDEDKNIAKNISCKFYGDFHLEQNPTTYMEALQVYKQLPTLLKKNNECGVPLKVWLYPLSLLNKHAARLVSEISTNWLSYTEAVMEELEEAERRCNDLLINTIDAFDDIKKRVHSFQSSIASYKAQFKNTLRSVLPYFRGGVMEEQSLEVILQIHNESPFIATKLNQWLDNTNSEIDILSSYTKSLHEITIEDSNGLQRILVNSEVDVVVCLALPFLRYVDPYLLNLKVISENPFINIDRRTTSSQSVASGKKWFGDQDVFAKMRTTSLQSVVSGKKWFEDQDVIAQMRENMSHLKSFSEANKHNKRMRCIISAVSDPSLSGSSIYLYEKGILTNKKFQLISKPPQPIVSVHGNTLPLTLQESPTGERVHFRVEYKEVKPEEEKDWLVKNTTDENFTLTGLKSGKQYLIRYRIVSQMGMGEASDTVSAKVSLDCICPSDYN